MDKKQSSKLRKLLIQKKAHEAAITDLEGQLKKSDGIDFIKSYITKSCIASHQRNIDDITKQINLIVNWTPIKNKGEL